MIIDHTHIEYIQKWQGMNQASKYNGAYYYSCEIVENIIPAVKTDRNWITVNVKGVGCDHAIVFIHNNAKILGCKLKAYDKRFPKVSRWKALDNMDAVKILQEQLDQIDGVTHG